ncbi:hypothetical protein Ccrd_025197 [Cynara cardunculus var. scolymus]|uniref:Uncharacterized protein n=1 Tax=Cynara cardunculus var. scolymus TaxID=59895 RepID=A0A103XB90_CYNCS|nr:hypothetical protein Ccrd_025197 [Cynara cardunculus var. scolymus]
MEGVKETLEQKAWRETLMGQFNQMMETMMERMDQLEILLLHLVLLKLLQLLVLKKLLLAVVFGKR